MGDKLAPANRVADYMSVHTFLHGSAGVLAPLIGFGVLASALAIGSLCYISAGMIISAAFLLIPTIRQTWKKIRRDENLNKRTRRLAPPF